MKTILRLAFLAAAVAVSAGAAVAQDAATPPPPDSSAAAPDATAAESGQPQHPHHPHGFSLKFLTDKLGLSQTQQNQIQPILTAEHQQAKAIFQNASLAAEDKHAQLKELRKVTARKIRAFLTPTQQATFDALRKHRGPGQDPQEETPSDS